MEINPILNAIKDLSERTQSIRAIFDYDHKHDRLVEVNRELEDASVWNKPEYAQALGRERAMLAQIVEPSMTSPVVWPIPGICWKWPPKKRRRCGEGHRRRSRAPARNPRELAIPPHVQRRDGRQNCYLDIQAGSGGTEAQDWANIVLRMYLRWADARGFKPSIIELSEGDVAGIKGATVKITGEYAFGWLRTETGVHRLVRKSPVRFRRPSPHLVLLRCSSTPRSTTTWRSRSTRRICASTSTAPPVPVVSTSTGPTRRCVSPTCRPTPWWPCQNERSQHANKDHAMKKLRAKLYELEMQKRNAASQALEDSKSDIGWGSQIRSYVLDDSRIKDLRTGVERSDCQKVLDGDLDELSRSQPQAGPVSRRTLGVGRHSRPAGACSNFCTYTPGR